MTLNLYYIIAIIGILSIISGTWMIAGKRKFRRRYTYPLLILGGICLEIYSIYIKDVIFMILQAVFIISAIYGLIKIHGKYHNHTKRKIIIKKEKGRLTVKEP